MISDYNIWTSITDRKRASNYILQVSPTNKILHGDPFIFELMDLKNTNKILDFGSGYGRNTFMLADRINDVWAYDFSNMIKLLKEDPRFKSYNNITVSDSWEEVKKEKFDGIVCIITLQHIKREDLLFYLKDFIKMTDILYIKTRSYIDFSQEQIYPLLNVYWKIDSILNNNMSEDDIKECSGNDNFCIRMVHKE